MKMAWWGERKGGEGGGGGGGEREGGERGEGVIRECFRCVFC